VTEEVGKSLQIGANPLQRDNFRIPEGQDRLFDIVKKI
jgi:hypothetical protein